MQTSDKAYLAAPRCADLKQGAVWRKRDPSSRELRDMVRALASIMFVVVEQIDDEHNQVDAVQQAHAALSEILDELEKPEPPKGFPRA